MQRVGHLIRNTMFKNAIFFKLTKIADGFTEAMESATFTPCGPTQEKSIGWVPPRNEEHGALVENIGGQLIVKLAVETKTVPKSEIEKVVDAACSGIEDMTGRKPGKKEKRELKENALLELLPQAFPHLKHITVWIDREAGIVVVDAASQGSADDAVTALVRIGFELSLVNTQRSPQGEMVSWLFAGDDDSTGEFSVGRECVLKSSGEDGATVKFSNHNLNTDEVRKHINEGKLPTKLALSWGDRVGFVLTDSMQLKKVEFLDGALDSVGDSAAEDRFDADVALSTGVLAPVISDLIEALGGELEEATE